MRKGFTAAIAAGLSFIAADASAAYVPNAITGIIGIPYHAGDSGTFDANGNVQRVFNGGGLNVGNTADPATWTHVSNWQDGWQSNNSTTSGTLIADLGSTVTNLDDLYIWNVTEAGGTPLSVTRGAKTIDIYYSTTPSVTPVAGSVYNFTSGGWMLLASDINVTQGISTGASPYNALVDLSTIPSARYIGFALKENYGHTTRIGLAEVQITAIPEPTGVALAALAGVGLLARRRRRWA